VFNPLLEESLFSDGTATPSMNGCFSQTRITLTFTMLCEQFQNIVIVDINREWFVCEVNLGVKNILKYYRLQ